MGNTNVHPGARSRLLIFGRRGGFGSQLDLETLDGTNGYRIDGVNIGGGGTGSFGAYGSGAGDVNHDGVPDLAIGATNADPSGDRVNAGQIFVIYGGLANLAALDLADGSSDGVIALSGLDGTDGFTINGAVAAVARRWSVRLEM